MAQATLRKDTEIVEHLVGWHDKHPNTLRRRVLESFTLELSAARAVG